MGITWCRERLEQAQNSKNPVDRILIRCSNAMKPKTYSRSQDRLADDIVYRGVRKDNLEMAPPRPRARLRGAPGWHSCVLTVSDDPTVAPIPPPRKKRKRKMNGDVNGLQESSSGVEEKVEKAPEAVLLNGEKRRNRYVKQSESRRTSSQAEKEEKPRRREQKMRVVKNVSTVSLPNYNELAKPARNVENFDGKAAAAGKPVPPPPRRNMSTTSLPGEGVIRPRISSLSEATIHRLEMYMKRCRSFGSLKPQQLLEKLEEFHKTNRSESESSDSWSGLDDWDMGVIEYCDPETAEAPPLLPKSTLPPRNKLFSVGTPQGTPRRQSPVSEMEEEISKGGGGLFDSESVPSDWFSESQNQTKLEVEERTKTPPPSPANLPEDSDSAEDSPPSLLEMLTKDEDLESDRRESGSVEDEPATKPPANARKFVRNRSQSLIVTNPNLLGVKAARRLSTSERTTRLLEELTLSSDAIEKELLANPEQILNRLRRASLRENLPEDPFEMYLRRKKPSLRESLSVFLGFQQEQTQGGKAENAEEKPPPLPVNPPPPIPPESSTLSLPLVTVTADEDPPRPSTLSS